MTAFHITVRVTPGASRTSVGGSVGDSLRVRVTAPALDGRATQATLEAIADAFEVRSRAVTLVSGPTARTKIVAIEGDSGLLAERLKHLLDQ